MAKIKASPETLWERAWSGRRSDESVGSFNTRLEPANFTSCIKITLHHKQKREPSGSRFNFPLPRTYSVIFPKLR